MSRIGNMPIPLPKGVTADIKSNDVTIKGAKGSLTQSFHPDMKIELEDGILTVKTPSESRQHKSLHGLTRALLNNMVVGVSEGFSKNLEIEGVGYRAEAKGSGLVLHLGYSHPVEVVAPSKDVKFTVENRGRLITIEATDKQVLGELAANIRKLRPPEPYKGKGIRYQGEHIRRKAGKAGKV